MALFYECIQKFAQTVLDSADIVRDGDVTPTEIRGFDFALHNFEAIARPKHKQHSAFRKLYKSSRYERKIGPNIWGCCVALLLRLWHENEGEDIAEYAVMLAVILVLVVGTIRLVGSSANNAFSSTASSIQ